MSEYAILYPVFVMFALTLFVYVRLGMKRFKAVKTGEMDGRFFKSYRGYDEPEYLRIWSRHAVNLTELPILFYVGVTLIYVTSQASAVLVGLAWVYALTRVLHSSVHLGSNKIINRFGVYAVSCGVLVAMWTVLLAQLLLKG